MSDYLSYQEPFSASIERRLTVMSLRLRLWEWNICGSVCWALKLTRLCCARTSSSLIGSYHTVGALTWGFVLGPDWGKVKWCVGVFVDESWGSFSTQSSSFSVVWVHVRISARGWAKTHLTGKSWYVINPVFSITSPDLLNLWSVGSFRVKPANPGAAPIFTSLFSKYPKLQRCKLEAVFC